MDAEAEARNRLARNGRNTANDNAGIRVGSDLHLCEMLLAKLDSVRALLNDPKYIRMKADYNQGRLSWANMIEEQERGLNL